MHFLRDGTRHGPYKAITETVDGLLCDGMLWSYTTIGDDCEIIEDDSLLPPPAVDQIELAWAKNAKLEQIIEWKQQANDGTFTHGGKVLSCAPGPAKEMSAIASYIALHSTYPPDFPLAWRAVDMTLLMLPTIVEFKAMFAAMTAQGLANFMHSEYLSAVLEQADTPAEVAAIAW